MFIDKTVETKASLSNTKPNCALGQYSIQSFSVFSVSSIVSFHRIPYSKKCMPMNNEIRKQI